MLLQKSVSGPSDLALGVLAETSQMDADVRDQTQERQSLRSGRGKRRGGRGESRKGCRNERGVLKRVELFSAGVRVTSPSKTHVAEDPADSADDRLLDRRARARSRIQNAVESGRESTDDGGPVARFRDGRSLSVEEGDEVKDEGEVRGRGGDAASEQLHQSQRLEVL